MKLRASIDAITTDVSSTLADFDFVFKLMAGGATAAEKMKIASTGAIAFNQAYTVPDADGNGSEFLQTDAAANLSFAAGGGTPAGATTQIQFNNAGSFGASSRLTFNSSTNALAVGSAFARDSPVSFTQDAGDGTVGADGCRWKHYLQSK